MEKMEERAEKNQETLEELVEKCLEVGGRLVTKIGILKQRANEEKAS